MIEHNDLSALQADVLKEVGNIGAGHAATALSTLLQDSVNLSVTSARACRFVDIPDLVGGSEEIIAGVFLRVDGEINGNIMFLLPLRSARRLIRRLLPQNYENEGFTELEVSALCEVGNILGGSYLNAISMLASFHLQQSVPSVAIDMAGAILDICSIMAGATSDEAIVINTNISHGDDDIEGHVFLLPDPDSTLPLLRALGGYDV